MDKIIYLESDEEIISVFDRLKNIKEKQVALVIPAGAVMLSSAINLKLLKEEGDKIEKKVSIVTSDATGRNLAAQIGFTVYENLGDAREIKEKDLEEQEKTREFKRESEKRIESSFDKNLAEDDSPDRYTDIIVEGDEEEAIFKNKKEIKEKVGGFDKPAIKSKIINNKKFWFFGAIGFLIVLFLLVFIFPKATVFLNVYASEEKLNIGFNLSTEIQNVEVTNKTVIPASWESKEQEVSIVIPATGKRNVGDKARGTVVIYNRSGRVVNLAAGTEFVSSDGKLFVIPGALSVPGAFVSEYGEMIPGKSSGDIEAAEGGTAFNIKPSKFTIPALSEMSSNLIYGQTEETLIGGTDKDAKVVSKEDIEGAKKKAEDEMEKKLAEDYGMEGDRVYIKGLGIVENLSEEIDKKENDEADNFTIKTRARFSFLVFDKKDFDKMFEDSLKLHLSNQKQLVGSGYRGVDWEVVKFDEAKKEAELLAKVTILTATSINQDYMKSKIVTLNVQELRTVLSQYPEVELDRIRFFPPLLVSSIPASEKNVRIEVEYVEK